MYVGILGRKPGLQVGGRQPVREGRRVLPIEVLGGAQISNQGFCQCIQSCCWGLSRQQEGRFASDNSDNGGPGDNKHGRRKEVAVVQQTVGGRRALEHVDKGKSSDAGAGLRRHSWWTLV